MSASEAWDRDVSRKLGLRNLYVFFTVAEQGSMAKAAAALGVTQSAVSQIVASLEEDLNVRLFERSRRGAEPTIYGRALLVRGRNAFDELRNGLLEMHELLNEGTGEIRIGCPETLAASVLPVAIDRFNVRWPRVRIDVDTFYGDQTGEKLRKREVDLVLARGSDRLDPLRATGEFEITPLFDDRLHIVVGAASPWKDLGRGDLVQLSGAPWIALPYGWGEKSIPEAFRRIGASPPDIVVRTFSVHLRLHLVVTGRFVTALPESILRQYRPHFDIRSLPIEIENSPYDVVVLTLKNRTQRRVVDLFIKETLAEFEAYLGS